MNKKKCLKSLMACLVIFFSSNMFAVQSFSAESTVGLPLAMYALQVTAGLRTAPAEMTINVPGDYPTIQEAIDAAIDNTQIIVAAGTYSETLNISKKQIRIYGAGAEGEGKSVISGSSNDPSTGDTVIYIEKSKVIISGFLITNGKHGINIVFSEALFENSQIENNYIGINTSTADISCRNDKIINNDYIGANITSSSQIYLLNCEVTGNTNRGVQIFNNSGGFILNSTINNNLWGLQAVNTSSAQIQKSSISQNVEFGIMASFGSSINLAGGNTVSENGTSGCLINFSSSIVEHNLLGNGQDIISDNQQHGVILNHGSTSHFEAASIAGNYYAGVVLTKNSTVSLESGTSLTNNGAPAILFDDTCSFEIPKAPADLVDFTGNAAVFCFDCSDFNHNDFDGDGYRPTEYEFDGISSMANKGDCNDLDSTIYPGATEVCGDTVDNDCDGEVDEDCE